MGDAPQTGPGLWRAPATAGLQVPQGGDGKHALLPRCRAQVVPGLLLQHRLENRTAMGPVSRQQPVPADLALFCRAGRAPVPPAQCCPQTARLPSAPCAGGSAGRASQQHMSPLGGSLGARLPPAPPRLSAVLTASQRAGARGPFPSFPRPSACPLTLILSASFWLWQKTPRPWNKPLCLADLHSLRMLCRKQIFWASSWQAGDKGRA